MPLYRDDAMRILTVLFGALVLLFLIAGGYATATKGVGAAAGGALIIVAGCAIGLLFGLLFGAPHSSDQTSTGQGIFSLNTSFDQMSDWLTKILVGVGLTQLVGLPSKLQALGSYLAPAVGGGETSASVATTLALGSAVIGFLISFIFTKLVLSPDLADAGYETLRNRAQTAVNNNPAAQQLAAPDRIRAARITENLAKEHLTRRQEVKVLDPKDWIEFANQAVKIVSESKKDGDPAKL